MKYYEVTVEIKSETEDSKGNVRIKTLKENYLVDAMSVTEAEARVVKLFSGFSQDYQVVGVKGSKIIEVVESDADDAKKSLVKISQRLKVQEKEEEEVKEEENN
jgi:hypothetical protein